MRLPHPGWVLAAILALTIACDSQQTPAKKTPPKQQKDPAPKASQKKKADVNQWKVQQKKDDTPTPVHRAAGALGVYGPLDEKDDQQLLGRQYLDGAELQFRKFRRSPEGHKFALQLFEGDASQGLDQLQALFGRNPAPVAVLGHVSDREALEAVPKYQESKTLMLPLMPGGAKLLRETDQAYRITYDDAYYGRALAALAKKKGWSRVLVLAGPGPHARRVAARAAEQAASSGLQVVENKTAVKIDQAAEVAGELAKKSADVTLVIARNSRHALALVRGVFEGGGKTPVLVSDGGAGQDFLGQMKGPERELYVATGFDPTTEAGQEFHKRFLARYERAPDLWAALAYDLAGMFIAGLNKAEISATTFERYLRRLSAKKPYVGITGKVYFDRTGQAIARPVHLLRWDGKRFTESVSLTEAERLALRGGKASAGTGQPGGLPTIKPGEVKWHTSVAAALDAAEASGRPIMVDFWSKTCVPCEAMAKATWPSKVFEEEARYWTLLRVNLDTNPLLVQVYQTDDLPAFGYWTPSGAVVALTTGFKTGEQMAREMKSKRNAVRQVMSQVNALKQAASANEVKPQLALAGFLKKRKAYLRAARYYENAQSIAFFKGNTAEGLSLFQQIIQCRSRADDPVGGLKACLKWIKQHPKSKLVEYAHYMAGVFLKRMGKAEEARAYWEGLLENFPEDNYFVKKAIIKLRN